MSTRLKEFFFKPKWEHKQAAVRADAVAHSQDPRLIALLPVFTLEDADPDVRLHAMRRVDDLTVLHKAAFGDSSEAVRQAASRRLVQKLCEDKLDDMDSAVDLVRNIDDANVHEALVQRATQARIRAAALPNISRQGLLGDIAIKDRDADIRSNALDRIEQSSTLERVVRAARKKDKKLYHKAVERLNACKIDKGDAHVSESLGQEICDALRALALDSNSNTEDKKLQFEALKQRWGTLGDAVDDELKDRYATTCAVIERELSPSPVASPSPISTPPPVASPAPVDKKPTPPDGATDEKTVLLQNLVDRASRTSGRSGRGISALASHFDKIWQSIESPSSQQQDVKSQFDEALQKSRETVHAFEAKLDAARLGAAAHLDSLEQATADGDLAKAREAQSALMQDLDTLGRHKADVVDQDFRFRLTAARGKLGELRDWQRWSNDKIRDRLCDEAEQIGQQQLHPDAVVEKIKALQTQWRTLADSENLHGERGHHGHAQYRRFRKACNAAFEVAKPFFEKRAEVREKHLVEMEALCESIEALPPLAEQGDWKRIMQTVSRGRRAFKDLDNIPPKSRSKIANRLRGALDAMEPHLNARSRTVGAAKRALLREAEGLIGSEDQQAAAQRAKEIQREWQAAGRADRATERKLWKAFRAACDQIFAKLDAEREQNRSEQDALLAQQDALCLEAEALIEVGQDAAHGRWNEIARLQSQWNALGVRRSPLERRFATALEEARNAHSQWLEEQAKAVRQRNWDLLEICIAAENQSISSEEFESRTSALLGGNALPDALQARLSIAREALEGKAPSDDELQANLTEALNICIRAEFVAGIESPEQYQQQRMDYQVERLAEQMGSGAARPDAKAEGESLQLAWLGCGPLSPEVQAEVSRRFSAAMKVIFGDD